MEYPELVKDFLAAAGGHLGMFDSALLSKVRLRRRRRVFVSLQTNLFYDIKLSSWGVVQWQDGRLWICL